MRQNNKHKKEQGFIIKWLIILGTFILMLSYFGFDLKSFIESDTVKENFTFIKDFSLEIWDTYLAEYFHIFWNYIQPLLGPVGETIGGTDNVLDLLDNISIPEPSTILPEITPNAPVAIEV